MVVVTGPGSDVVTRALYVGWRSADVVWVASQVTQRPAAEATRTVVSARPTVIPSSRRKPRACATGVLGHHRPVRVTTQCATTSAFRARRDVPGTLTDHPGT